MEFAEEQENTECIETLQKHITKVGYIKERLMCEYLLWLRYSLSTASPSGVYGLTYHLPPHPSQSLPLSNRKLKCVGPHFHC